MLLFIGLCADEGDDMSTSAASDQVRQFTVSAEDDGIRLDRWFKRNLPDASFNLVSRWARTGQLRVDGKRADAGRPDRGRPDHPRPAGRGGARGAGAGEARARRG